MGIERVGDLEVGQDLDFERRSRWVQKIGWSIFGLIIVAALMGIFGGGGPLNVTTVGQGSPLEVEYERFARHSGPTEMLIRLGPDTVQGEEARVWIDREYLNAIKIEKVEPEPESVEAGQDRLTYIFKLERPDIPTTFLFHITPQEMGLYSIRVGIDGGKELRFSQFTYP